MENTNQDFIINLKTAWKKGILFSGLMIPFWFFILFLWYINLERSNPNIVPYYDWLVLGTNICYGLVCGLPLFFSLLRRKSNIFFTVHDHNQTLVSNLYRSNIRVKRKEFNLHEILRFDVLLKMKTKYKRLYESKTLALTFHEKKPFYITKPAQEEETIELAKELNKFLSKHTQLDELILNKEIIPYMHKKQQNYKKVILSLSLIAILIAIIMVIIAIIVIQGNI